MITKYNASTYTYKITKCEFDRETKATLFSRTAPLKVSKKSHQISYFDDFESAKEWLLQQTKQEVEQARYRLQICNSNYGNVKGLKP
jgi:hypothetical protein